MPVSIIDYTTLPHSSTGQISPNVPFEQLRRSTPTTLVICDDQDLRMLLIGCLQTLSYPAVGVAHGQAALAALGQYPIQRVILDLPLAINAHITTCAEIREQMYDTEIVVLSASTAQTIQQQTPGRGGDWYMQKPFRLADLHNALQSLHARGHRVRLQKN